VQGSTADADGVGAAAAVPVAAGEDVLVAATTVAVPSADVGDGSAAVGVGVLLPPPHAARVTATPMAIAAMQMRCVRLMTGDSPFQLADAQMDSVCLLPTKPVYAPVSIGLSLRSGWRRLGSAGCIKTRDTMCRWWITSSVVQVS
jgi:hypothetical protein